MDAKPRKPHWMVRSSRTLCAMALVLLVAAYFGSYCMLLGERPRYGESTDYIPNADEWILISPSLDPLYGEEYKVDGNAVRLFFRPANRLHRLLHEAGQ